MDFAAGDGLPENCTLANQMVLPNKIIKGRWTHSISQRSHIGKVAKFGLSVWNRCLTINYLNPGVYYFISPRGLNLGIVMKDFVRQLDQIFEAHANPGNAVPMSHYMKDQFQFFGIKSKERRTLTSAFLKQHGRPDLESTPTILRALWKHPKREMQYVGLDLLKKAERKAPEDFVELCEELITRKSWWDTVDALAVSAGQILARFPDSVKPTTQAWIDSKNMWLRRSALLFQLKYKDKTDWPLLKSYLNKVLHEPQFFIQKACGWALRQYSKTDPEAVRDFVEAHQLSSVCRREAIKYI